MTDLSISYMVFTIAVLLVSSYGLYAFCRAIYIRYVFMNLGQGALIGNDWPQRISITLRQVFGHTKLLKDRKSGVMHIFIFYGFLIVQLGAIELIIKGFIPGFTWNMGFMYPAYTLTQEWTVTAVIVAIFYAAYRRYGERIKRLKVTQKASIVIFFIAGLMLSVLLSLAFEAILLEEALSWNRPFSSLIQQTVFFFVGSDVAYWLFYTFWWAHLLILLSFMVYVPQSKHAHLLFAPVNILFSRMGPPSKMLPIDFTDETAEEFGSGKVEDFSSDVLLDTYACVECGRCTNMCPGSNTGKMLSPMHIMTKVRDHLNQKGEVITSKSPWVPGRILGTPIGVAHSVEDVPFSHGAPEGFEPDPRLHSDITPTMKRQEASWKGTEKDVREIELIGDVMTEQEIWACTTCRNCEDQCPVGNEHLSMIYSMRQHLVMMQGKMPADIQRVMNNTERQSNPWGLPRNDRIKWREERRDLDILTVQEVDNFEYLFWVGSMSAFDQRTQKVAYAFIEIMNQAGVSFAILGNEEKSTGDTVRRAGNEYLFQELAQQNIETLEKYHVQKIVTIDPHIFNVLKNEYPDFGLENVDVFHHTQLIQKWIEEKRIQPKNRVDERVVYHDSCYIGRYNGIYDTPRNILRAIPGIELLEMARNKEDGLCCGAGGGRMWMEEDEGERVNVTRVGMALDNKPTVIGSNCPYCLTMMGDGVKSFNKEEEIGTFDLAEIVARSISPPAQT